MSLFYRILFFGTASLAALLLSHATARGGSATWSASPANGDWNTAQNWSPATVPNGPSDLATFDVSDMTAVSLSLMIRVNGITFRPGADSFTITIPDNKALTLDGAGIVNHAGAAENFLNFGTLTFRNDSVAANATFINSGDGGLFFLKNASADHATIVNNGSATGASAETNFHGASSAGHATITNNPGQASGARTYFYDGTNAAKAAITLNGGSESEQGGIAGFYGRSTAGDSRFAVNGGNSPSTVGTNGGAVFFDQSSDAGAATFILHGGTNDGDGGNISFSGGSSGGTARIIFFGNAYCDASAHSVTTGSLEGAGGTVYLGKRLLTTGSNDLSTTFAGVLQDGGIAGGTGGALAKIGAGTFTLSGASTYTGGTTVTDGALAVNNESGSATGSGPVKVDGGALGGRGTMAGPVAINAGGSLSPALGRARQSTITTESELTFNGGSTYAYTFKARSDAARTDSVVANGVTIGSGANLDFSGTTEGFLAYGLILRVITNTSATPINGNFSNLPDRGFLQYGGAFFEADYNSGDGNDLDLVVTPPPPRWGGFAFRGPE